MLVDQMRSQGTWLFRYRSFLPLLLLPAIVIALLDFRYPFGSHALDLVREMLLLALAFVGLALRVATVGCAPKGTSGRNTKRIKADDLNATGMYSVVRHPLYLANYIIFLAVLLDTGHWWLALLGSVLYWLYYERIAVAEESFLLATYGQRYQEWASRTPAFLPRFSQWQAPALPFCWRSALRREYSTAFMIILCFTAVEVIGDWVVEGKLQLELLWMGIFFPALALYLLLRLLKKKTQLLDPSSR